MRTYSDKLEYKMNFQITVDELRKKKLFVATPMYGGQCLGMYAKAALDLQTLCAHYRMDCRFSFIFNESLITRARNYLVDEFLRSGFTHLMFIDSDIHFNPNDVIALLALDKDIIGGPYPKKSIKWSAVVEAYKKNPNIPISELEKVVGDFVFNPAPGTNRFNIQEPIEVLEIGTGFMMVKREVFEKFESQYPELRYKPDHVGQANFDGSRHIHAFFDTVIDSKPANFKNEFKKFIEKNPAATHDDVLKFLESDESSLQRWYSERYLSEDYMFCQWWRNIGGKIWLCPWMKTHHVGTYAFTGDMAAVAQWVGTL